MIAKTVKRALFPLILAALAISAKAGTVIGCFDINRASSYSPSSGSETTSFRDNIASNFPGATFQSTNTLTSNFLSSVNLLVLGVAFSGTSEITPLSGTEQAALTNFVLAGGALLIFADNDLQFQPASQSEVQPFGLDCTGSIAGSVAATVTNLSNPVADGPFGKVTNYTIASYPGWFDALGSNAVAIAILNPNSHVSLAAIAPGVLSATSGGVVFFSDTTIDNNSFTTANAVPALVDNAVEFALTPVPTLFITKMNDTSVMVYWATNVPGFRLQQTTNLLSAAWTDQSLTGLNEAVVTVSNSAAFFRLIKP